MNWPVLLIGALVGVVSGVIGIGGGVLLVPILVWYLKMDQIKAQGTSLGALLAPVGLLAVLKYYQNGNVDLGVAAFLAAGFLVGGYIGAVFAQHIPELWLGRLFGVAMILIGFRMLLKG